MDNDISFLEKNRLDELAKLLEGNHFQVKSMNVPRFDFDHPFGGIQTVVIPLEVPPSPPPEPEPTLEEDLIVILKKWIYERQQEVVRGVIITQLTTMANDIIDGNT